MGRWGEGFWGFFLWAWKRFHKAIRCSVAAPPHPTRPRFIVEGLNLSYLNKEAILFTIGSYYGNSN